MKIVVTSKKPVMAVGYGRLPAGVPVEVADQLGLFLIERGEAVRMETKEAMDRPLAEGGEEEQSSSLPVGQASTEETSSESEAGEPEKKSSKTGRKAKRQ
jgi:stringent starvation protein B